MGSGGQRRRGLEGKGPTPAAKDRQKHPAAKRAAAEAKRGAAQSARPKVAPGRKSMGDKDGPELLVGRNPVVEALRAEIPAIALYVALGIDLDERINEAVRSAANRGLTIIDVTRTELDRMTGGILHQGIALKVPPYEYSELPEVLDSIRGAGLLVALDGVTDPRNLGAVVRSASAFGAHGVIVPQRRAAGMTATAWRTSAGAAARLPVTKVTNLVRALKTCQDHGYVVVGLDADGATSLDDLQMVTEPTVIVVGSEGRGLSRLVAATCDQLASIPMAENSESLNASVAAAVTLAEVARRRRAAGA